MSLCLTKGFPDSLVSSPIKNILLTYQSKQAFSKLTDVALIIIIIIIIYSFIPPITSPQMLHFIIIYKRFKNLFLGLFQYFWDVFFGMFFFYFTLIFRNLINIFRYHNVALLYHSTRYQISRRYIIHS